MSPTEGTTDMVKLRSLKSGDKFRFTEGGFVYVYCGNGWYNTVESGAGGPWHTCAMDVVRA